MSPYLNEYCFKKFDHKYLNNKLVYWLFLKYLVILLFYFVFVDIFVSNGRVNFLSLGNKIYYNLFDFLFIKIGD